MNSTRGYIHTISSHSHYKIKYVTVISELSEFLFILGAYRTGGSYFA